MHWLRYINRDADHHRHLSDHRMDTIKRTRPCGFDECVSARSCGQPHQDQPIIESENAWFHRDENQVFDHGYLARHPSDGCEFSGSTETATATGQSAQAVASSAGTGAGRSAVVTTNASDKAVVPTDDQDESEDAGGWPPDRNMSELCPEDYNHQHGVTVAKTTGQEPQAGMSSAETGAGCSAVMTTGWVSEEPRAGMASAGTGAGCSAVMTTRCHSSSAGPSTNAAK
jgi:hypothetical protein